MRRGASATAPRARSAPRRTPSRAGALAPQETHIPIMALEIVKLVRATANVGCPVFIDCTFGLGGHSRAVLEGIPNCQVIALDQDGEAVARAKPLQKEFGRRFSFKRGNFADMKALLAGQTAHAVFMDLGVSSMQLSTAARGFSLRKEYEGPLDMRMDQASTVTAGDAANLLNEQQLKAMIKSLGDEPRAASVARAIIAQRKLAPLQTTSDLIAAVARAKAGTRSTHSIHPATQTFQAFRMFVNDELGALRRALTAAESLLQPGGVLALLTFHSGEARAWKDLLRTTRRSSAAPASFERAEVVEPSEEEVQRNPRARSAHLRYAFRTSSPSLLTDDFLHADHTSAQLSEWLKKLEDTVLRRGRSS